MRDKLDSFILRVKAESLMLSSGALMLSTATVPPMKSDVELKYELCSWLASDC